MTENRRLVLGSVVVVLGLLTATILLDVLGTILFAITVAYVLLPAHRWFVRRGLSRWTAGVVTTVLGFLSALAILAPIVYALVVRIDEFVELIRALPESISVSAYDTTVTITIDEALDFAVATVQGFATSVVASAPVLALKFALFVILVFGLLLKGDAAARAAVAPIPHEYRDIIYALAYRAKVTLYAIYVLQVATAAATFALAIPFFWLLGYDSVFALAFIAALLQFVPIIGPSLMLIPIAFFHLVVGEPVQAAIVAVIGVFLIAWLPDIAVRPRLARYSAGLPGSLYFIGFVGGLFTLGPIGIVVGPLIIAVFVESVELLAAEVESVRSIEEAVEEIDRLHGGVAEADDGEQLAFEPQGDAQATDEVSTPRDE